MVGKDREWKGTWNHRLIPNREFIVEKNFMMPYYGTPQPPQEYMTEYHVRKDNTVQYRGNYYSVPSGTYRSGETTVWLQEAEGCLELYSKDTGKLLGRHPLNMGRGKIIYDEKHRRARNAGTQKLAERILIYVSYNKEVALWLENLRRRKERYYRSNLEVILRSIPSYDGHTLVEAIRMCLDRGIYNGESVRNLCECVRRNSGEIPENGSTYISQPPSMHPPFQTGMMQSYKDIFTNHDKT